jgi:hypothetical protein
MVRLFSYLCGGHNRLWFFFACQPPDRLVKDGFRAYGPKGSEIKRTIPTGLLGLGLHVPHPSLPGGYN